MDVDLECPLCCGEKFSSHSSLMYHLLSVGSNLCCLECQTKFSNIVELAMHVGRHCKDEETASETQTNEMQSQTNETQPNCHKDDANTKAQNSDAEAQDGSENQYYCSSCDVQFLVVEDHIRDFHSGEQIVLAIDKEDEKTQTSSTSENAQDSDHPSKPINSARILDTIQEENCVDKDGRLYVRKTCKIEKFWENGQKSNKEDGKTEGYECIRCSCNFALLDQYKKHSCFNTYKICNLCNGHFVNDKYLKLHLKNHPKVSDKSDLQDEEKTVHPCEVCNTGFTSSKSLRLHKRMHEPVKSKEIDPPALLGLEGEYLTHPDAPREMFLCKICNKSYDKVYRLAHAQFHSNDPDFTCEVCNRKFYTPENLAMHTNAHADLKKHVCPNCKKAFQTKEKLDAHKPDECETRPYGCQYCGRRFTRPHEKVKHERIHTGEKPHVCGICGKAFRVSYCLTLHMRTHSGSRPYACEICGKRFKAHSVYAHHLLTHSEDRNFKCDFCPKTFKTGVQLAGHKNSHIKPFNCTECNRPFASLYAVRAHMETHGRHNNLKFHCSLCGASYARAFALRDHFKEQHAGETFDVDDVDAYIRETENQEVLMVLKPNSDNARLVEQESMET